MRVLMGDMALIIQLINAHLNYPNSWGVAWAVRMLNGPDYLEMDTGLKGGWVSEEGSPSLVTIFHEI
jgi:hypothetical protein